jgi:hypothetical protein
LDEEKKGYISQQQFLKKFWAAYTYDDTFNTEDVAASRGSMVGASKLTAGLAEKVKRAKMF